jgi:hypothetical protein
MSFRRFPGVSWFLRCTLTLDVDQRRLDFCFGHQSVQKLRPEQVFAPLKVVGVV